MGSWPRLDRARRELRPRHQVRSCRELGHVETDFGEDDLGGADADAGDLVQSFESGRSSPLAASAVTVCFGNLFDELVDTDSQPIDLLVERVDLVEEQARELGVMGVESARQGFSQRHTLRAQLAESKLGKDLRI